MLSRPLGQKGDTVVTHNHEARLDALRSIESLRRIVSSEDVIEILIQRVENALDIADASRSNKEHVLVLPVVPRSLMRRAADTALAEYSLESALRTPEEPYFLLDVEVGRETLGFPPATALEILYRSHRNPMTIDQAVALSLSRAEECPDQILVLGSFNPASPLRAVEFTVRDRNDTSDEVGGPGWGTPSFAAII